MSEVANIEQGTGLTAQQMPMTAGTVQLAEWAQELSAAHQLGTALCGTEFVPQSFRGKPEAAAAAILTGKALGLDPMNALSNIFVVQGRPAMYARTMAALVLQAGHTIRRTEADDDHVVYEGKRKGETVFTRVEWTIDRAKKAGYTSNKKYQTDPIGMLTAKCQAEICRVIAPDVLTGIAYSSEEVELDDMGEVNTDPAEPEKPKAKRTVKRKTAPAPDLPDVVNDAPEEVNEPDPEADKETGEVTEEPAPEPEPLSTLAQQRKIADLLKQDGYTTKADMLDVMATWADRQISSAKDLTKAEAERFIAEFEQANQQQEDNEQGAASDAQAEADQQWIEGVEA